MQYTNFTYMYIMYITLVLKQTRSLVLKRHANYGTM